MTDQRFHAREHVRRGDDFRRVYEARHSVASGPLVAYALANGLEWNRIGLSVSKRVGCAVIRNQTKRKLREAFRLTNASRPFGYDFVIVAKSAVLPEFAELIRLLETLLPKAIARCATSRP
ncbi:MAG: ribonuclease P protein component [Gemmataceae bacterium]|nr:ribonuclease P protein component [Gemmataceae bacterium]